MTRPYETRALEVKQRTAVTRMESESPQKWAPNSNLTDCVGVGDHAVAGGRVLVGLDLVRGELLLG